MKLLIDTNVILDVLLARDPFCDTAERVLGLSQRGDVEEYVSASAITDIYYIAHRQLKDRDLTKDLISYICGPRCGCLRERNRNRLETFMAGF